MKDHIRALGALLLGGGLLAVPIKAETAKAVLANAQGEPVGTATLKSVKGGAEIALKARNLPPGTHAMHIHAVGKCEPPDFKSAGPHFNPYHKQHGVKNPQGAHAGDLPNFTVNAKGTARVKTVAKGVKLSGEDGNSLLRPGGTALVIHADADDEMSDPAGNAGARIACGVITAD